MAGREIFIEIVRYGDTVKVTAIDPDTGLEAVALGPASAARADLERIAVGKLERALEERREAPPRNRPGKLV